jgi:uncharacterized membrane protein YdjX (TVP38/TMEM64 family)
MRVMVGARAFVLSRRIVAVAAAAALVLAARQLGLFEHLSLEALREHGDDLAEWVDDNSVAAAFAYLGLYVAAVAMSVPCAAILTLSGGFLFGAAMAGPMAVVGSTIGATILFVAIRALVGPQAIDRLGAPAARIADGVRGNAASYLLALRFAPVVPFFVVNIVPALAGVRLRTFVLTTFVGVMPATLVFSMAGAGLGAALDSGEALSIRSVLTTEIVLALCGLAALTLASIPVRRWALAR